MKFYSVFMAAAVAVVFSLSAFSAEEAPKGPVPDYGALALEKRSRTPIIAVPRTAQPPKIDGRVDYKEWTAAAVECALIDQSKGVLNDLPTQIHLMYDDEALYVGVVIFRPIYDQTPRVTASKGKNGHIWWKDDNFELTLVPKARVKGQTYTYIFVGNSAGAYAEMIKPQQGAPVQSWEGKWEYAAQKGVVGNKNYHVPIWEAELKIPYAQFIDFQKPAPGIVWEMGLMNQQVTPNKKLIDWSQTWTYGDKGYDSDTMARLVFVDEGPRIKMTQAGLLSKPGDPAKEYGVLFALRTASTNSFDLNIRTDVYKTEEKRAEGSQTFFDLWDRIRYLDETGKQGIEEAGAGVQAFRGRKDILAELNNRYKPLTSDTKTVRVTSKSAPVYNFKGALTPGEYLIMTEMRDAKTSRVLFSQIMPYSFFPGFNMALRPYYLKHQKLRVMGDLSSFDPSIEQDTIQCALYDSKNNMLDQKKLTGLRNYDKLDVYLDAAKAEQGDTLRVRLALLGPDGKEKHAEEDKILRPKNPEWFGNNIGKSKVVPPPFVPLAKVNDTTIKLYERVYVLGASGLPKSIISRDTELLAAPIKFDLQVEGQKDAAQPTLKQRLKKVLEIWKGKKDADQFNLKLNEFSGREATWSSSMQNGQVVMNTACALHYDGLLKYTVKIKPVGAKAVINRLVLNIPMKKEWARYYTSFGRETRADNHAIESEGGLLERFLKKHAGGVMPFTPVFFLGAEDRGIQWYAASDKGWSNADNAKKVSVRQQENANVLSIAMIDKPLTIAGEVEYVFGITVTPIKPVSASWKERFDQFAGPFPTTWQNTQKEIDDLKKVMDVSGMNCSGNYLNTKMFGCPRLYGYDDTEIAALSKAGRQLHDLGLKFIPYSGWGVNSHIPDFKYWGYEMLTDPYKDISYQCFLHTAASTFPDWFIHCLKNTAETVGIDGNYMDSTQLPRFALNELEGFAWTDAEGRKHGTWDIWAMRDFCERLYIYWHVENKNGGRVGTHTGSIPLWFSMPFSDYCVSGEQHQSGLTLDEKCPLDEFLTYYYTYPQGLNTQVIWWNWWHKPIRQNHAWAQTMLHDDSISVGSGILLHYGHRVGYNKETQPSAWMKHVRDEYADARMIPYYNQKIVTFEPSGPLASLWVDDKAKAVYIFVANIPDKEYKGRMRIAGQALPVAADAMAWDAMLDQELGKIVKDGMEIQIEPMRYRMISIGKRIPHPPGTRIDKDADFKK